MNEWIYYKPKFECDELNYELLRYSPWSGHRNFAYDFINYFKPKVVVELGSYYGCSTFAFMQAIKDFSIDSKFYAVDTWAGDDFTKNDYKENVYLAFSDVVNKCFDNKKLIMLRKTFDEAVKEFNDNSIDLLHIDGSHHYEDAKHDCETWIKKVKEDGVIMFHDISSDLMYGQIMGSHRYWQELKEKYRYTVEFDFSYGLGIVFLSKEKYSEFMQNIDMSQYQRINNSLSVEYKDELRKNYFTIEDNKYYINDLKEQVKIKDFHLNKYEEDMSQKEAYIYELKEEIKEKNEILVDYSKNVEGKDKYIFDLEKQIKERDISLKDYEENIKGKDGYIFDLEKQIYERNITLDNYSKNVEEKDKYIGDLEEKLNEKDKYIKKLTENIENNKSYIKEIEEELKYFRKSFSGKIRGIFKRK